jgi:transglutaminase-like putative cysteine protease
VALVYAVRDGFRYDPYRIDLSPAGMKASTVLANGYGWCVPKATLLAAACRAAGIPARLGFADVRNHLSTERMRETMKTDLFVWHGYTDLWIDGAWRKATPAFNLALCERFGLLPLDFDGLHDSIYHPFDLRGPPAHGIRASARELRRPAAGADPGFVPRGVRRDAGFRNGRRASAAPATFLADVALEVDAGPKRA